MNTCWLAHYEVGFFSYLASFLVRHELLAQVGFCDNHIC